MVDPAAHDEIYYYQDSRHQMVLTPTSADISQEHLHRGGARGSSRRVGNVPNAAAAAGVPPFIAQQPEGIHHFQGPSFSPPPAWLEPHPRGMEMRGTSSLNAWSINSSGFSGRASRRSTGGKPPSFRNDFTAPRHAHPHYVPHPLGPAGARSGVGGGGGVGNFGDFHLLAHQHRAVPSLRAGTSVGTKGFSVMRPLPLGCGGAPTRHRAEFFHPMAPLRETLFLGSPLTHGLGGCVGEMNPCVEAGSRILIANSRIGAVIGRGGAIIKHIREVSGAKITISESCRGDHCDTEDRMVTMTGTFNAVQLAITHILSHAGAAGPNANPVMGPCGGDCLANAVRILIPNVKAGGLIGRSGFNIKTIRERSGACITLSTRAFILYTAHGPLQSPYAAAPNANRHRGPDGGIPAGAPPRFDAEDANDSPDPKGAPEGVCDRGDGPSSDEVDGTAKSTPIVPDRILKAEGTFDACLRVHHLVVWKLMDVRPSSAQTPPSEPAERVPVSAATAFAGARAGSGVRGQRTRSPSSANTFNEEPFRGGGRNRGRVVPAAQTAVKVSKASPSPAPSASKHLSPFRRSWGLDGPALVPMISYMPPAVITPEPVGGKGSGPNTPPQASSPPSPFTGSPRGSTNGSVENFGAAANEASAMFVRGPTFSPVIDANDAELAGAGGGEVVPALDAGGAASAADRALEYSGGVAVGVNGDDGELPPCLAGVFGSFVRGRSSIGRASSPARSPSTMTGIDVAVQRSAFSLLDVHDLDDIKNLSGAGISAPDSPESFGNLSDNLFADAFVVPGTARRSCSAEGSDLAGSKPATNQTINVGADSSNSASSLSGSVEGVGEEADKLYGMSRMSLNHGYPSGGTVPELGKNMVGPVRKSSGFGNKGVVSGDGRFQKSPLMKMVRITGTVEEVQLAEYLIRVRTTDLYNAVACRTPPW